MADGIETLELRKLAADLRGSSVNVGPMARLAVRKTAKDIQATARRLAPYKTGKLKSSITTSDLRRVGTSGSLEAEVGPEANYGRWQEIGTSTMAPQPFMGPATDKHEPAFLEAMAQLGEEAISGKR